MIKKLPSFFYTSWILNLSSIISMGLIAFAAPLIFGMNDYGTYVIETAVILVAAGILEAIVVISLNESGFSKKIVPIGNILILVLFFLLSLFLLFEIFFSNQAALILFFALTLRTSLIAINTRADLINLPIMILSEIIFSLAFILYLVLLSDIFTSFGYVDIILANSFSQILAALPLLLNSINKVDFKFTLHTKAKLQLSHVLTRLSEDTFYLLIPFLVGIKGSSDDAAALRIVGSTIKASSKLVPIRFDTLLFYLKKKEAITRMEFSFKYILFTILISSLAFLILQELLNIIYDIDRSKSLLLLAAPFVILVTILAPVLMAHKPNLIGATNILILIIIIFSVQMFYENVIYLVIGTYFVGAIILLNLFNNNMILFSKNSKRL